MFPHKFEIPALRFPSRDPVNPCKHLQCTYVNKIKYNPLFELDYNAIVNGPELSDQRQQILWYFLCFHPSEFKRFVNFWRFFLAPKVSNPSYT